MSNPTISLTTGITANAQIPTDAKRYFVTYADMIDLGENNFKAYKYYDGMTVMCAENKKTYIWQEVTQFDVGNLAEDFFYPANLIVNGIDYSGKKYDFVEYKSVPEKLEVSGGLVTYSGNLYQYWVSPVQVLNYNGASFFISLSGTINLDPADAEDRFDNILVDLENQNIIVQKGIPNVNPQIPYYNPETFVLLSTIRVSSGTTTPTTTFDLVYNEYVGQDGGEYDAVIDNPGAGFEFDYSNPAFTPFDGSLCILYNDLVFVNNPVVRFFKGNLIDASNYTALIFRFYSKARIDAKSKFQFFFTDNNDNVISNFVDVFQDLIADTTTSQWNQVTIPMNLFNLNQSFKNLIFRIENFTDEFFIDKIEFEVNGTQNPSFGNTYLDLTDTTDNSYNNKKFMSPVVFNNELVLTRTLIPIDKFSFILKLDPNNNNLNAIEENDTVFFKRFTVNGILQIVPVCVYENTTGDNDVNNIENYDIPTISN